MECVDIMVVMGDLKFYGMCVVYDEFMVVVVCC